MKRKGAFLYGTETEAYNKRMDTLEHNRRVMDAEAGRRKRVKGKAKKVSKIACDSCGDYMSASEIEDGVCANCGASLSELQRSSKVKTHGSWREK